MRKADSLGRPPAAAPIATRVLFPRNLIAAFTSLLVLILSLVSAANGGVNSYGQFITEIPIAIPPFHGLEPKLTLTYQSNPANGWIGAGWVLNGGPSYILRRSKGRGAPRLDSSDIFLLDGIELVPCAPQSTSPSCTSAIAAFGSSDGFYSTKTENFQRIRHVIGRPGPDVQDFWYIWTKTGTLRTFAFVGSLVVRSDVRWALTTETDTHGNKVSYSYLNDANNEWYLGEIYYNDIQSSPGAHIRFYSVARPDIMTYGVGNTLAAKRWRLQSIDVLFGGSRVRVYNLNYHTSASTSGSLLDSVQVFGLNAAVNCGSASGDPCDTSRPQGIVVGGTSLPPIAFQYDETATGAFQSGKPTYELADRVIAGDFNGDGKTDFLSVDDTFNTYLSSGDGTFTLNNKTAIPNWCTIWDPNNPFRPGPSASQCFLDQEVVQDSNGVPQTVTVAVYPVVVGDFNGDGKTDFMVAANNLEVFLSNGDGTFNVVPSRPPSYCHGPAYQCLSAPAPGTSGRTNFTPPYGRPRPRVLTPGEIITGDFNGDGKTDFMVASDNFYTYLSNGDGTFQVVQTAPPSWCRGKASRCLNTDLNHIVIGDFDGDGRTDFLSAKGNFDVFRSNGDGTFTWIPTPPPVTCTDGTNTSAALCLSSTQNAVIVGDFNGDGKTDFASAGTNNVFLSNGDGSFTLVTGATLPPLSALNHVIVGDFNGDGKTDFLSANANFDIWVSLGDGHFQKVTGPPPPLPTGCPSAFECLSSDPNGVLVGDFNGDGKTDFLSGPVVLDNSNGDGKTVLSEGAIWLAVGGAADHLIKMSNGLGGATVISYAPSTAYSNAYLPVGTIYQTVKSTTVSDGRGVSDTHTYNYAGGLWDDGDQRFLGFRTATEIMDAAGNYTQTLYSQAAACPSQPVKTYSKDPQGSIFGFSIFSYVPPGAAPYHCLLSSRVDYQAERTCNDDSSCKQSARAISTNFLYDNYGNLRLEIEHGDTTLSGDERTTQRGYNYNTMAYIVALPAYENVYSGESTSGKLLKRIVFAYDGQLDTLPPTRGDLTQRTDWNDQAMTTDVSTNYSYDAHGNLTALTDANKHTTTTQFDQTYSLYGVQTCNALGQCSTFTWDTVLGKPTSVTDANGASTKYSYDVFGRRLQVTNSDGGTVQNDYEFTFDESGSPTGQKVREAVADGSAEGLWTAAYLNGLGRTYRTVKKGGYEKDIQYSDATQSASSESTWYLPPDRPQWTQYLYDGAKRRTHVILADGSDVLRTGYGVGDVLETDALGHNKAFYSDAYGRTTKVQEGSNYATTFYMYDVLGRLTQVDSFGNYALTTWDSLGRKLSMSDPDMGTWKYRYDAVGNLLSRTDAKGETINFTYDALNRVLSKTYPDGSKVVWNYDEAGHGASKGRLTSISEFAATGTQRGSDSFFYDTMGRTNIATKCRVNMCGTVDFVYDLAGRLSRLVYPDSSGAISLENSETVVYRYDASGRLASVVGNAPYVSSITYEPDGQVSSLNYGNGTSARFSYDPRRRWLSSSSVHGPGSPQPTLYSASYSHDPAGRITAISSPTNQLLNLNFTYDDLDRLTEVTGGQTQQFAYDDIGNMKFNSTVGAYTYPSWPGCSPPTPCFSQPHAVIKAGNNTYTYDANGNITSGGGRTISWNYDNLPVSVTTSAGTTSFDYDASNRRVSKKEPGDPASTCYFSRFVERTPSGSLVYSYYAGPILVARRATGKVSWYQRDHLASVRLITDGEGNAVHRYDYSAFGSTLVPASDPPDPYGFTGQLRNPSTAVSGGDVAGLIYMNARYYDATLGRFISADSIVPNLMNPQSLNRYSYVHNNPVMYADPSGHLPVYPCPNGQVKCSWPRDPTHGEHNVTNEMLVQQFGPPNIGADFMRANAQAAAKESNDFWRQIAFEIWLQVAMDQLSQESAQMAYNLMNATAEPVIEVSDPYAGETQEGLREYIREYTTEAAEDILTLHRPIETLEFAAAYVFAQVAATFGEIGTGYFRIADLVVYAFNGKGFLPPKLQTETLWEMSHDALAPYVLQGPREFLQWLDPRPTIPICPYCISNTNPQWWITQP